MKGPLPGRMAPGATGLPGLQNETLLFFSNVSHSYADLSDESTRGVDTPTSQFYAINHVIHEIYLIKITLT